MATIEVSSVTSVIEDIDKIARHAPSARKMVLTAMADVFEPALRNAIRSEGLVRSGTLLESVERSERGFLREPILYIGPTGEHHRYFPKRGKSGIVRSGHVGYIQNYGLPSKHIRARNFIEKAIRLSDERVNNAAEKAYDEFLKSINL